MPIDPADTISAVARRRTRRSILAEYAAWCLAFVLVAGMAAVRFGPSWDNDSYQYLSEAGNIVHGRGLETSIVFYDVERRHARVPAPLTTFPPGYALAVAPLEMLGMKPVPAAVFVSIASCGLAFVIVMALATQLGLGWVATRAALAFVLFNSAYTEYSIAVMSEGLFTGLICSAVFLYILNTIHERPRWSLWWAAGLLLGLAAWTRYAGVFLLAGVGASLFFLAVFQRRRGSWSGVASMVLPAGLLAALLLRNRQLSGNWRGGSGAVARVIAHPVADFLKNFPALIYHSLFGYNTPVHFGVVEAILGLGLVALAAIAVAGWRRGTPALSAAMSRALFLLATVLLVYVVLLIYNVMTTAIFYTPRYFMPLVPLFAVVLGIALDWLLQAVASLPVPRRGALAALLLVGFCYIFLNLKNLNAFAPNHVHNAVAAVMNEPTPRDGTLRQWVDSHVSRDAVIVASSGQATGYAWDRKTVSLAQTSFSSQQWTGDAVQSLMREYHAPYIVVYRNISAYFFDAEELEESPFLAGLAAGRLPGWLEYAVTSQHAVVLRLKNP